MHDKSEAGRNEEEAFRHWSASVADHMTIKNRTIADNHPVVTLRAASFYFCGVAVCFSVIARLFPASCPSLSRPAAVPARSGPRRPLPDVVHHVGQTAPVQGDHRRNRPAEFWKMRSRCLSQAGSRGRGTPVIHVLRAIIQPPGQAGETRRSFVPAGARP